MLIADVVDAADRVGATRSRIRKVHVLSELLQACLVSELPVVTGLLTALPRQGRIGVGWSSLRGEQENDAEFGAGATLMVLEFDAALDDLARHIGEGSVGRRAAILGDLRRRSSAAEWEFITHVMLGDLRIGALGGIVLDAIAAAFSVDPVGVRRAHLLTGDLGATAVLAKEGPEAVSSVGLVVLRPIAPMLAATSRNVAEAVSEVGMASVEWKLDGARIQVHRRGAEVKIVTRNLNDVTHRLPEVVDIIRSLTVDSVVLDGEVLRMRADGRPEAFQETMSRFGTEIDTDASDGLETLTSLRPYFFDCMHLNGEDLLDAPLADRLVALAAAVGRYRVPQVITDDPVEAQIFADDALDRGHEGVMVKAVGSHYEAGRRGSTWRKVKPVHTLDLVVLAAEWGHGRRQGWLSNLHLGARADDGEGFVMVGKTFKGLTDAMLTEQTAALLAREVRRAGITVFVRPELVVEIAIDGAQRSTRYPGGVALRFARVKGYRPDRDAASADLLSAVQAFVV